MDKDKDKVDKDQVRSQSLQN